MATKLRERLSRDEIYKKVMHHLADALGVDDEDCYPSASLKEDLGAESIDYLDIVFRLEKEFGISIPKGELFPEDLQDNPDYVRIDGRTGIDRYTGQGLNVLRKRFPQLDLRDYESDPIVNDLPKIITVKYVADFVESKLGEG